MFASPPKQSNLIDFFHQLYNNLIADNCLGQKPW